MKIILIMAVTADGKIAKSKKHMIDWTSKEDKSLFFRVSKKHRVVLMGENTFRAMGKPFKDRLNVVFTKKKNWPELKDVLWVSGKIKPVLKNLEKKGYRSAILAGGSILNTLFLKERLIDEMIITVEPKIFGKGLSLFNSDFNVSLKLLSMGLINRDSLALKYKLIYN